MTVPHYGKRAAGLLTAASPGDTLHFQFASYNDSGDSEALSGFAVTDIEVFKNGIAATRATDSGYSLISDTGQIGDRAGLYRFSVQLFNTADDTGHYESGAWYQVAVDGVVIDGKTVRLWVGSFEIGEPRANVVQLGGDTGAANWLRQTFASGFSDTGINQRFAQIQSDVDTGLRVHIDDSDTGVKDAIADLDTGIRAILGLQDTGFVNNAVWNGVRASHTTAGSFGQYVNANLVAVLTDTGAAHLDAGRLGVSATATLDTGVVNQAVWQTNAQRKLTVDTGIADQVWMQARSAYATDTGTFGEHLGGSLGTAVVDTGVVNQAVWQGNGTRSITNVGDTGIVNSLQIIRADLDTGLLNADILRVRGDTGAGQRLFRFLEKLDTGGDLSVSASVDTGFVNNAVWNGARSAHTAAGTFGQYVNANLVAVLTDTGAADLVGGRLNVSATASVDTGVVNQAVWQGNATRVLTANTNLAGLAVSVTQFSDTGVNERLARIQSDVDTGLRVHIDDSDTGVKDTIADLDTGIRALLTLRDTGAIASAVWNFTTRSVTNVADTGIVNSLAIIRADLDTGLLNADVLRIRGDTGGADRFYRYTQKLDTGGDVTVSASVDTGVVNQAVWQANASRGITNVADTGIVNSLQIIRFDVDTGLRAQISDLDTGLHDTLADYDTGVRALLALQDTGAVSNAVWNFATRSVTNIADTGIVNSLAIIRADTDTGIQSSVTVTGFSDTGINDRLAKILADTDTGIQSSVAVTAITDTGIYSQIAALATASSLSAVGSNVSSIKTQTDKLLFDTGGEVRADIRRVNNITVQGTGDTGTADYWRPGT